MRYMVIESYTQGPGPVYARAAQRGRMLPPGLVYLDSWIDERRLDRCFQLMETEESTVFDQWIANWSDLVEFEIVPVITSTEASARLVGWPYSGWLALGCPPATTCSDGRIILRSRRDEQDFQQAA